MSEIASGGGSGKPPSDDQIFVPEYLEKDMEPEVAEVPEMPEVSGLLAPLGEPGVAAARGATSALKVPPHSIDAEQSVLGGLMLDNDAWFNVAEVVLSRDFYRGQHQIIFDAMTDLAAEDQPLDAVTVSERLQAKGTLDKAGGLAHLAELTESTPGASNVVAYAQTAGPATNCWIWRSRKSSRSRKGACKAVVRKPYYRC
jgi:hypothetical protein